MSDTWLAMFIPSVCLISISSGISALEDVQKDLLRPKQVGKLQAERFLEERSKSNVGLYETIRKNMLKAITSMLATKAVAVKEKEVVVRYKRRYKKGCFFTAVKLKKAPLI